MSHRPAGDGRGVGDGSGTRCMSKRRKNANLKTSFTSKKKKLLEEQLHDGSLHQSACVLGMGLGRLLIWTPPSRSAAISQRGCGSHHGAALIDPSTPRRRLAASQSRVYFHSGGLFYHSVGGVVELQRNRQAYRGPR